VNTIHLRGSRRRTTRPALSAIALFVCALLAACGQTPPAPAASATTAPAAPAAEPTAAPAAEPTAAPAAPAAEPTAAPAAETGGEVVVTWPMKQQIDPLNAIAQQYAQAKPGLQVKFQAMEAAANEVFIRSQLQAGEASALLNPFGGSLEPVIQAGYLAPWDPYLDLPNPYADNKPWKDTLNTQWLIRARYTGDNKLYTLPIYADMAGLFYNKTIFSQLGITPPTTWAEWMDINAKLKAAGYEPVGWAGNDIGPEVWLQGIMSDALFRHLEADIVKDPNFKLNLDDPYTDANIQFPPGYAYCAWKSGKLNLRGEEVRFMFERMGELAPYIQQGFTGLAWEDVMVSFANQRAASFYGAGWLLPILQQTAADLPEDKRFEVGFFPIPGWGDKAIVPEGYNFQLAPIRSSTGGGAGNEVFALNAKASEEERLKAVDFVMYVTAPKTQSSFWNTVDVGMFPIAKDVPNLPIAYQNPPKGGTAIMQLAYDVGSGGGDYYKNNLNIWVAYALGKANLDETVEAYAKNFEESYQVAQEKNNWTCE
jgi:ABC-type glycerol-3-phosphate transport system substrate-binding protein